MTLTLGAHVDSRDPLADAAALGAEVVQIFLGDPQSWKKPGCLAEAGAAALKADASAAGVSIVVHAPYVINVASTNNRIRIPSRKLLQQCIDEAAAVGAFGVVVHGGHVTAGEAPSAGFVNWRKCIDALRFEVPIFIENTAGGNHAMTRHLDSIEALWAAFEGSPNLEHVGFCLDTCHAHAGGLDLDGLVAAITAITGRVDVVHCNDSRDAAGSGADRHANLGHGQADPEAIAAVVRDARTHTILETPGSVAEHAADLAWLRDRVG